MIQVNSGLYQLNHIKAPKQIHLEFWARNLSQVSHGVYAIILII